MFPGVISAGDLAAVRRLLAPHPIAARAVPGGLELRGPASTVRPLADYFRALGGVKPRRERGRP